MENVKSILLSKTFWFNILAGFVAVATYIDPELLTNIGVDPSLQPRLLKLVGSAVAIINIILRYGSKSQVTLPGVKKNLTILILFVTIGLGGCSSSGKAVSFTKKAQDYLEKHCPKSYAENPLTGKLEIHYQCDSLWTAKPVSDECGKMSICIDVLSGSVSGDVECSGLLSSAKLKANGKK